jgi:hypothetical protein
LFVFITINCVSYKISLKWPKLNLFFDRFFTGDSEKKETKGQCSLYKGRCGGSIKNTCCKTPYKCSKQTKICGKDKLCCVSEADIQRHKQDSGSFLAQRGG